MTAAHVVTPLPPLKPKKHGYMFPIRTPKTATQPVISSPSSPRENGSTGKIYFAKRPTRTPFNISRTITVIPHLAPMALATFVPPAFPLPIERMSFLPINFVTKTEKFILPTKYPTIKMIKYCHITPFLIKIILIITIIAYYTFFVKIAIEHLWLDIVYFLCYNPEKIGEIDLNIVIIGQGKIGRTLTKFLVQEDHNITVIDINPKTIERVTEAYDVMGVEGNGASYNVQLEAGVNKSDLVIACTSSDEVNILCCLLAKKLGTKHTIARVRNPEYSNQLYFLRKDLGLSMIVNPESDAASEIFKLITFPSALKLDVFARGKVELAEIKIDDGNPLDGLVLSQLYKTYNVKILVCVVERDDGVYIPGGDFVLKKGDKIYITASHAELSVFFKLLKIYQHKLKKVMIIGGGRVCYYLASQLIAAGADVKIIEQDEKRCSELSDLLPKANIIFGDGTNQNVLSEEGFDDADAVVSLTGIDEENMIISMYAQKKGIKKVITKINRLSFVEMLNTVGLESIVSPKQISANRVLSYIRAMTNNESSSLKTMYKIVDNKVEALEFEISENSDIVGIPLKDLRIKKEIIIGCIIRRNQILFPGGNDSIEKNDSVIVITKNQGLKNINDIIQ